MVSRDSPGSRLGLRHRECEPEGKVRGGPQEGDQEAAALPRPDQDLDPVQRDQGQEGDRPPSFHLFLYVVVVCMLPGWMELPMQLLLPPPSFMLYCIEL